MKKYLLFLLICVGLISCQDPNNTSNPPATTTTQKPMPKIDYPSFDGEATKALIQKQVDFGPRVPGTPTHKACADWLEATLKQSADKVIVQKSEVTVYNGKQVPMYNIIASFNPDNKERIMLSAHWDTRPFADQDVERVNEPIEGANDGGSGVAVLLEIAKMLKQKPVKLGVDIMLWDVEDYGKGAAETYCLGSQYWSKNKHIFNYRAKYGILLDMVGAKNAIFYQEGTSLNYAKFVVDKVWKAAHESGYRSYFSFDKADPITDDHLFINALAGIPTIDIIQYDQHSPEGFFPQWHTHEDNMEQISSKTLKAVGQTLVKVIYDEDAR